MKFYRLMAGGGADELLLLDDGLKEIFDAGRVHDKVEKADQLTNGLGPSEYNQTYAVRNSFA